MLAKSEKLCYNFKKHYGDTLMLEKIKKLLSASCILFTVFVFILLTIYSLIYTPSEGIVSGLSLETCLLLFACSVLMRVFHGVLNIEKLPFYARVILHYLLVVGTAFGSLMLIREATGAANGQSPITAFIILSLFSLIYIGFSVIYILIRNKKLQKENAKKDYSSIVKK